MKTPTPSSMAAIALPSLDDYTSQDDSMRRCLDRARIAARTDIPVLLLGESGTGKTLLARAVHGSSARRHAPFVSFNAAALSETLLDSQLFGHEAGAFTGATRRVKGKFELAHRGTLFIDEIADMTAAAQAKILRAVEYGEFERLGSESLEVADVRLVSATHLPIDRHIESETFRKDLFYRISGFTIAIPPLRERPNDLSALVASEMAAAAQAQGKGIIGLSKAALHMLLEHVWPGNLRELRRVIHTAVALTDGTVVPAEAVLIDTGASTTIGDRAASAADTEPLGRADNGNGEDLTLRGAELRHIHMVLARTNGNKRRAARTLGVSRTTLDRKLADHGLLSHSDGDADAELPDELG